MQGGQDPLVTQVRTLERCLPALETWNPQQTERLEQGVVERRNLPGSRLANSNR